MCTSGTKPRSIFYIPHQGRSQEGGRGNFKLVMIQSSHRFGLAALSPNLSESSLAGWAPALRLRCTQPRAVRARYASPQSPPAKLNSDKFGSSRRDQTGGVIESHELKVPLPLSWLRHWQATRKHDSRWNGQPKIAIKPYKSTPAITNPTQL